MDRLHCSCLLLSTGCDLQHQGMARCWSLKRKIFCAANLLSTGPASARTSVGPCLRARAPMVRYVEPGCCRYTSMLRIEAHKSVGALLGSKLFPGLEGVPVPEMQKVIFIVGFCLSGLLSAPVLSAGEQAGADTCRRRPRFYLSGLLPASARSAGGLGRRRHSSGRPTAAKRLGP